MILGVALLNGDVTSTGKTAEILGIPYRTFYENIGKYEDIKIGPTFEDIIRDCKIARNFG